MDHKSTQQNPVPGLDAEDEEPSFSLVSNRKLRDLYAAMLRMRLLIGRSSNPSGRAKLPAGREAMVAGVAIDLVPSDTVLVSPENLLPGFLRGMPLEEILSGRGIGPAGSLVLASDPGSRFNLAIGAAIDCKMRDTNNIAVVFADAREFGSVSARASLIFSGAQDLPLIFVCDSLTAARGSRAASAAERAKACGVPGIAVDGNDAVAVYRVACESLSRARKGRGPTLIDCQRFCPPALRGSTGRTASKAGKGAFHADPVAQMEQYLANKGIFRTAEKEAIRSGFEKLLKVLPAEAR
jgi:pyruvate dehydrogenase E1 component alpha subunit